MRPSSLSHPVFLARFGPVYEGSPWAAEAVWPQVEAGKLDDPAKFAEAMRMVVNAAPRELRLALIRAHPELASRTRMAEASVKEQARAGLDQCSPAEFEAFQRLNAEYAERFGHPFIVAVKGLTRADILERFEARLANDPETEFATAMAEIHQIAGFRLEALFAEG
jgi:2-oxo-4-hydroxy-4-carboxy-5-ureidoimidazoline decarboxylase